MESNKVNAFCMQIQDKVDPMGIAMVKSTLEKLKETNMKRFTLASIICILILSFTSCGDKVLSKISLDKDLEYCVDVLTWEEENDFFEPVKGTYKLIEKDGQLQIKIKFVKTEECKHQSYTNAEFVLLAADKNDKLIQINGKEVEFLAENKTEVVNNLLQGKIGDKVDVVFTLHPVDKVSKETIISNFKNCFFDLSLDMLEDKIDQELDDDDLDW